MELLGPDFRFSTPLRSDSVSPNGILNGNLYILGGYDPTLGSRFFPGYHLNVWLDSMTAWVKNAGIREIHGSIVAVDPNPGAALPAPGWSWDDLGWYYGAIPGSLSIADNYMDIELLTGPKTGDPVKIIVTFPKLDYIRWENHLSTAPPESKADIQIPSNDALPFRQLIGSVPLQKQNRKIRVSIPDPAYATAWLLHQKLTEAGIPIGDEPIRSTHFFENRGNHCLGIWKSPPLSEIITDINHQSNNLSTEMIARYLAINSEQNSSAEIIRNFWLQRGLDSLGIALSDGNGLSRYNSMTPENFTRALTYIYMSPISDAFRATLAQSGMHGTLAQIGKQKQLRGKIQAKSGSMSGVRGYIGFVNAKNGEPLAFAILWNQFLCPQSKIRQLTEAFWLTLLNENPSPCSN